MGDLFGEVFFSGGSLPVRWVGWLADKDEKKVVVAESPAMVVVVGG